VPVRVSLYIVMDLERIIRHIFSYNFPSDEELVEFANSRHGFGGDDGSYGVTYPTDLDAYERDIQQQVIPDGCVEIYCSAYTDKDIIISEHKYLSELDKFLKEKGSHHLASEIKYL